MDNGLATTTVMPEGDVDEDHPNLNSYNHHRYHVGGTEELETHASNENEAPVSERAASAGFSSDSPGVGSPRVQFEKIREEGAVTPPHDDLLSDEERKSRRHHHKHDHKSVSFHFL